MSNYNKVDSDGVEFGKAMDLIRVACSDGMLEIDPSKIADEFIRTALSTGVFAAPIRLPMTCEQFTNKYLKRAIVGSVDLFLEDDYQFEFVNMISILTVAATIFWKSPVGPIESVYKIILKINNRQTILFIKAGSGSTLKQIIEIEYYAYLDCDRTRYMNSMYHGEGGLRLTSESFMCRGKALDFDVKRAMDKRYICEFFYEYVRREFLSDPQFKKLAVYASYQ